MYERILVATDGSELSDKAVSHSLNLAKIINAQVIAVKIIPNYPHNYLEGSNALGNEDVKKIEAQWDEAAKETLDKVENSAKTQNVKVKTIVIKSDEVAEAIITKAMEEKVNLIVMASHGRKGIKRLLLGSETQHVLTRSEIPVLVLR